MRRQVKSFRVRSLLLGSSSLRLFALLMLVFANASSAPAQSHPIARGIHEADQAEAQNERNIPPPSNAQGKVDEQKLSHEADELANLAQTLPSDVVNVRKGTLPKDLIQKLKQIEKISKHLRAQLER